MPGCGRGTVCPGGAKAHLDDAVHGPAGRVVGRQGAEEGLGGRPVVGEDLVVRERPGGGGGGRCKGGIVRERPGGGAGIREDLADGASKARPAIPTHLAVSTPPPPPRQLGRDRLLHEELVPPRLVGRVGRGQPQLRRRRLRGAQAHIALAHHAEHRRRPAGDPTPHQPGRQIVVVRRCAGHHVVDVNVRQRRRTRSRCCRIQDLACHLGAP